MLHVDGVVSDAARLQYLRPMAHKVLKPRTTKLINQGSKSRQEPKSTYPANLGLRSQLGAFYYLFYHMLHFCWMSYILGCLLLICGYAICSP